MEADRGRHSRLEDAKGLQGSYGIRRTPEGLDPWVGYPVDRVNGLPRIKAGRSVAAELCKEQTM